MLLLNRFPHSFGTQGATLSKGSTFWINENYTLLPQELKKLNYTTHMLGKWHLGSCHPAFTPMGRGFDTFYGMWYGGHNSYYNHTKVHTYDWWDGWNIDLTARVRPLSLGSLCDSLSLNVVWFLASSDGCIIDHLHF